MSYIGYYEDCCNGENPPVIPATNKYNIIEINVDFTAEKFNFYSISTLSTIVNVTLPSNPQNGDWVGFIDRLGTFATRNLVIKDNGSSTIKNDNSDLIIDINDVNFKLVYNNGNWFIFDMSVTSSGAPGSPIYNITTVTNNFIAEVQHYYAINTINNVINVTLPSNPVDGYWMAFIDIGGNLTNNNLIIIYNNIPIASNHGNFVVNVNFVNFKLVYNNNNWILIDSSIVIDGRDGSDGTNGVQGIQGIQGPTGGVQGTQGLQGPAGSGTGTGGSELFNIINTNSSNLVTQIFNYYNVSTASNIVNVTLPSNPTSGQWVGFIDSTGSFAINSLVIKYNGVPIRSNPDDLIIDVPYVNFKLVFNNNNWILLDYSAAVVPSGEIPGTGNVSYSIYDANGTVNALINSYYLVNTTSGIATINLPSTITNGDWIIISDKMGTFSSNKAVLKYANGKTIANNAGDVEIDFNNAKLKLVYFNNNWDILNHS